MVAELLNVFLETTKLYEKIILSAKSLIYFSIQQGK